MASTVQTISTPGTTNWICPPGVTSVQVELWGGGGSGGPATGTASGGGGGAGGQYAIKQCPVVPGTTYAVVVAAVATANTTNVVNGNDSTFATSVVIAKGGAGGAKATGTTSTGGTGSTTGGVGDTVNAGGSGGNGVSSTQSGGGGGGAGSTGTGNSGSGATAGTAKANNGGAGGTGVTSANTHNDGQNYGGGGSGGLSSSSTDRAGGSGAQGLAVLTWTTPPTEAIKDDFNDNSTDTAKWLPFANGTAIEAETSGVVKCTPGVSNATAGYAGYDSVAKFDLTGSYVLAQIPQAVNAAAGAQQILKIAVDGSNYYQFILENGTLNFQKDIAGSTANLNAGVTYNATTHAWWRIRESGGTIFWDTSPDGISWTNQATFTNTLTITSMFIEFEAGTYQSVASPGNGQFDYLNMPTPVGRDISDSENIPGATMNQAPQRAAFF